LLSGLSAAAQGRHRLGQYQRTWAGDAGHAEVGKTVAAFRRKKECSGSPGGDAKAKFCWDQTRRTVFSSGKATLVHRNGWQLKAAQLLCSEGESNLLWDSRIPWSAGQGGALNYYL